MDKKNAEQIAQKHVQDRKNDNVSEHVKEMATECMTNMMTHEAYGNPDYVWSMDDFRLGKYLGSGKFGRVYQALEKKSQLMVAIKTLSKYELVKGKVEKQILREIEIQSHLKHPNIVKLLTWFHDDFRIYLVIEYATEGELYHHLRNSPGGRFPEKRAARYVEQVADALLYCHENHVIHRDIKPENLLLTFNDNVLLSDFGWSVHTRSLRRNTMCGTLDYLPPEMVNKQNYTTHVDQWCLGVLCYEFLVGVPPFESDNPEVTYGKIRQLKIDYPSSISYTAKDLISKLLVLNGPNRLTLKEVKDHPMIQKYA